MADTIIELTKLMEDPDSLKKDMEEAMFMMQEYVRNKYIKRIHKAVEKHQTKVQQAPSKEIKLMQVIKDFAPTERQEPIDQLIQTFMMMNTAQSIQQELAAYTQQNITSASVEDQSVHEDGIYDIDQSCLSSKNGRSSNIPNIIFLMALTKMI